MLTLIIVSVNLVHQWINAIQEIAPALKIWKYYSDPHEKLTEAESIVDKMLIRKHSLLNDTEGNEQCVIITTYETLAAHYRVKVQKIWQCKNHWSCEKTELECYIYDDDWAEELTYQFDTVILDEAHIIKNLKTQSNTAISWLQLWYICLTETMLLAGVKNWADYYKLLQQHFAERLWALFMLAKWDLTDDCNSYDLSADHSAVSLQLTLTAAKRFIYSYHLNAVTAGARLEMIWCYTVLRHTHAFKISFSAEKTIEDNLSKIHSVVLKTEFFISEQNLYKSQTESLLHKLIYSDQQTKKLHWSFETMHLLSLACVWTEFHHIEFKIRADAILKWSSDKNFIHAWLKAIAEKYSVWVNISEKADKAGQLALICCEFSKLRVLLQLLTDKIVHDQKKITVWCQYLTTQLLIYSVLQLTDVDECLFSASMTESQCQKTITAFNEMSQKAMMFISSYMIESCSLNL